MNQPDPPSDTVETDSPLLTPGGKVDAEAIRRAFEEDENDDSLREVRFTLQRDLKSRLDRYLTSRVPFMSRTQLQRLITEGGVTINGSPGKASTTLRLGDVVTMVIPAPPSKDIQPEEMPLDVLYEDEHLIVLNKQADVIVHPARSHLSGTLINGLTWHFANVTSGELSGVGRDVARPGVVHRLDRHTTGCIAFAKTEEAHWKLARQFERRTVDKRYIAVVKGKFEPEVDSIDLPIGPHPSKAKGYREKMVVRHDDLGKPALTICRARERYHFEHRSVGDQDFSLVELELKTGRTHQIRVHLSWRGYPIIGDDMYTGRPFEHDGTTHMEGRVALHAALLAFHHPISGQPIVMTAPPTPELGALIGAMRTGRVERLPAAGSVSMGRLGLQ